MKECGDPGWKRRACVEMMLCDWRKRWGGRMRGGEWENGYDKCEGITGVEAKKGRGRRKEERVHKKYTVKKGRKGNEQVSRWVWCVSKWCVAVSETDIGNERQYRYGCVGVFLLCSSSSSSTYHNPHSLLLIASLSLLLLHYLRSRGGKTLHHSSSASLLPGHHLQSFKHNAFTRLKKHLSCDL